MHSTRPASGAHPFGTALALAAALAATHAAAQTPSPPLDVPASAPRARPFPLQRDAVLDCAAHGAWRPPPGWSAVQLPRAQVLAYAPTRGAALLRGVHRAGADQRAALAALRQLLGVDVTLGAPAPADPAHPRRGRVATAVVPRGSGTAEVRWYRGAGRYEDGDAIWVAVVLSSEPGAWSAIDAARATWLQLVSHACQCGYDCDRRPR